MNMTEKSKLNTHLNVALLLCATVATQGCASAFTGPLGAGPQGDLASQKATLVSKTLTDDPGVIVIGHRGASGYLPEHTLESYDLAVQQGADFVEVDLVMDGDGALLARHENNMIETTDADIKFPNKKVTKLFEGVEQTGFFSEDFSSIEMAQLRAIQRLPFRGKSQNGKYKIPTFQQILDWHKAKEIEVGRPIGLYIELKHPTHHLSVHKDIVPKFIEAMAKSHLSAASDRVFVECFETKALRDLKSAGTPYQLILLVDEPNAFPYDLVVAGKQKTYLDLMKEPGLKTVREFAAGIGPAKKYFSKIESPFKDNKPDSEGRDGVESWVADVQEAGLKVHPHTFCNEPEFLIPDALGSVEREYRYFFALGVNGVFSDFPDTAIAARTDFVTATAVKPNSAFEGIGED